MTAFPFPVEAVIFDMDGLLLDTESVYRTAIVAAASAMGYDFPDDFCQSMVGTAEAEIHLILQRRFGADFPIARLFADCEAEMRRRLDAGVPVKAGAAELIERACRAQAADGGRDVDGAQDRRASSFARRPARIISPPSAPARTSRAASRIPTSSSPPPASLACAPSAASCWRIRYPGVRAAHASGAMAIMVPDMLPATDELRALCVAVVRDLHECGRCCRAARRASRVFITRSASRSAASGAPCDARGLRHRGEPLRAGGKRGDLGGKTLRA